jgi:hypothetical protein
MESQCAKKIQVKGRVPFPLTLVATRIVLGGTLRGIVSEEVMTRYIAQGRDEGGEVFL